MRIKNKYIRNRIFRAKHWKKIRNRNHPYETFCPYRIDRASCHYWEGQYDTEDQVKRHFEWIAIQSRGVESGHHYGLFHAPKHFRKTLWKQRKAQEKVLLARIRQGNYDAEIPNFKKDADWLWF